MAFTPFKKKKDYSGMPDPPEDDPKPSKLAKPVGPSKKGPLPVDDTDDTDDSMDPNEGDEGGLEGTPDDPDAASEDTESPDDPNDTEDDEGGTKQTASFALVRRAGETCGTCENYESGSGAMAGDQEGGDPMTGGGKCQVVAGQFSPDDSCGRFYMPKMGGDEGDSMHVPAGGGGKFHGLPEPPLR